MRCGGRDGGWPAGAAGHAQDIYERPATLFVADFVGRTNVLDGVIEAEGAVRLGDGVYRCDTRGLRRGGAKIVIRPHRVHVTSDRDRSLVSVATNSAHGSVRHVTYIGDVVQYGIDIGVAELKAEVHTLAAVTRWPWATRCCASGRRRT